MNKLQSRTGSRMSMSMSMSMSALGALSLLAAVGGCAGLSGSPVANPDAGASGTGGAASGTGGSVGPGTGGSSTGSGGQTGSGGATVAGTGGRTGGGGASSGTGGATSSGTGGASSGSGGGTSTGNGGTQGTITRVDLTGKKVLFIVGSPTSPSTGDTVFQGVLTGKGMVVTLADSSVVNPNAATMDLIVASDTAGTTFPTLYNGVAVPMIIFGNSLMQAMGMIATSSAKGSLSTPVTLTILDASTRMAAGLAVGTTFSAIGTTRNTSVYWGTPAGRPVNIVGVMGAATEISVFAYEKGAMMATVGAADRRVALAWKTDAVADLSIEAFKVMNAALEWTAARL